MDLKFQLAILASLVIKVIGFASLYKGCVLPKEGFGIHQMFIEGFEDTPYSFVAMDQYGNEVDSYVPDETYYISVITTGDPFRMSMFVNDGQFTSEEDEPLCEDLRLNFLDFLTSHTATWIAGNNSSTVFGVALADACTVNLIQDTLTLTKSSSFELIAPQSIEDLNLEEIIATMIDENKQDTLILAKSSSFGSITPQSIEDSNLEEVIAALSDEIEPVTLSEPIGEDDNLL